MVNLSKKGKSFLGIKDLSVEEITHLLDFASEFKLNKFKKEIKHPPLKESV